ncbi:unnamed protein product [Brassica oleracea]
MLSSLPTPHSHSSFSGGGVNSSSTISRKKMNSCYHTHSSFIKLPHFFTPKSFVASHRRKLRAATTMEEASGNISAAPISLPEDRG